MSNAPPSGWTVTSGVWGTNLAIDTSNYISGLASVKLSYDAATAVPEIWSPWVPITNTTNLFVGRVYMVPRVRIRASSIAAGNTVTVQFIQYQQDRTTVTGTSTLKSTVLSAANSWEEYGTCLTSASLASAWGRFKITKANNNFNVWADQVFLHYAPPFLQATGDNTTTLTIGVWSPIKWSLKGTLFNIMDLSADSLSVRIYETGVYSIHTTSITYTHGVGNNVLLRIYDVSAGNVVSYFTSMATQVGEQISMSLSGILAASTTVAYPYTFQVQVYPYDIGLTLHASSTLHVVKNAT